MKAVTRRVGVRRRRHAMNAKRQRGHHLWCTLVAFFSGMPSVHEEADLWRRIFEATPRGSRPAVAVAFRGAKRLVVERVRQ